jgi:uncharacterized Zn finger protein/DNA-binding XRE family transcriptional regulator
MRDKGSRLQPVRIEGRAIARTFWGKAWCEHLEGFSDFENRLPRGRSYVRNGSVCHLEILKGEIKARVSGSRLYTVSIEIAPLSRKAWKSILETCTGKVSSILDLLQGRLSTGVMDVVTDREHGMFPKPREIAMSCSCPDWAVMCKHVAAVLYGVGTRLDESPELLFLLRGVNHEELINAKAEAAVETVLKGGTRRRVAEKDLGEIFGLELDDEPSLQPPSRKIAGKTPRPEVREDSPPFPAPVTGKVIRELRDRLRLTQKEFASLLDVSGAAVSVWERTASTIRLQLHSRMALQDLWEKTYGSAPKRKR